MEQIVTVKDFYKYIKSTVHQSDLNSLLPKVQNLPFWSIYNGDTETYDQRFLTMFRNFKPFPPLDDYIREEYEGRGYTDVEILLYEFQFNTKSFLVSNKKRYEELYRTYIVDDEKYHILDNYDVTETTSRNVTKNDTDMMGSRSDTSTFVQGSQSNSVNNKVAPYDTETFYNETSSTDSIGGRTDDNTVTKGSQTDTHNGTEVESFTSSKKGNIGVQTGSDMLRKHDTLWTPYEFYDKIFKDIAKEFLMI